MFMIGLFDRPVQASWIKALRAKPVIEELTEPVINLNEDTWRTALARLRETRLLDPEDALSPDAIDAHPLVREWFGKRLRQESENAWRAAHGRLYEHLRDTTKEGDTPTLEELAPLYQSIAHGVQARRQQEVLDDVYIRRICKFDNSGELEFYAVNKLGAHGSALAALFWFFDRPVENPSPALAELAQSWVLSEAAFSLRTQGRFKETLLGERAALRMAGDDHQEIKARRASNLSETELLVGNISEAVNSAAVSVKHADRSGEKFFMSLCRAFEANARHAAGYRAEAEALFVEAERYQREGQPRLPLLYSFQGYVYCDLFIEQRKWDVALERANQTLKWVAANGHLLSIGMDTLNIGRAALGQSLSSFEASSTLFSVHDRIDHAISGLRAAGADHQLPKGLLARAVLRRSVGDWGAAASDLDEVNEIAELGPLKLYLCDMALECARLAFAQVEAFAPLNGMLEKDNPPKPEVPTPEKIAELKAEAEKQIKIADDYIQSCGYHRRDEELAELKDVLAGKRTFASLPPRV